MWRRADLQLAQKGTAAAYNSGISSKCHGIWSFKNRSKAIISLQVHHATVVHQYSRTTHKTLHPSALIEIPFCFRFYRLLFNIVITFPHDPVSNDYLS